MPTSTKTPASKTPAPRKPAARRPRRTTRDLLTVSSCCEDWMKAHHDRRIALAKAEREARS